MASVTGYTKTQVDALLTKRIPRVLGLTEASVPLYSTGTAQAVLAQVAFTVPATPKPLRVRVSGGSVTAASVIGVVFTLAVMDTTSTGRVIRNVGRTLPAAVADPIPALERIIDLAAGPQVIQLLVKPAGNVGLAWANNPTPDESPLQLLVEEVAL